MSESAIQETIPQGAKDIAIEAACGAGAILRERLAEARTIEYKGSVDLVTDADHAAEEYIRRMVLEAFADHRFVGEEGVFLARAAVAGDVGYTWIVDPLDGTTNYAHRYPHFATSIALEHRGQILLGVVYDPMRDELFVGERGGGATLNGRPMHVSTTDSLLRSLLGTGFAYDPAARGENMAIWDTFMPLVQGVRRDGSAALNMCYVAAGRLDGFWERPLNAWDISAGAVMVEEAGGTISGYDDPFDPYAGEVVAANPHLHGAIRRVIDEARAARGA
jgi:myo-inositol-1(or 4)-monophosphatase